MKRNMRYGEDGPLLLAMMLNNNNNNNANKNNNNNVPATDTLQLHQSSTVLEYEPANENSQLNGFENVTNMQHGQVFRAVGFEAEKQLMGSIYEEQKVENADTDAEAVLSAEQLQFWERYGYLVIEAALNQNELSLLKATLMDVVERLSDDKDPLCKQHLLMGDNHADVEDHPVVNPNGRLVATLLNTPEDNMKLDPLQRIRRMGTGVHRVLPAFRAVTFTRTNQKIASSLGFMDPRITQSIVITKPRGVGAEVIPHQDGCSSFTNPASAVTFWYALQDASTGNGCLKVVPGSHRTEPLTMRTRRSSKGYPEVVDLPEPVYANIHQHHYLNEVQVLEDNEGEYVYTPLEVKAGTLVLMHGNLVHASDANRSATSDRLAYNFGVVEGTLPWPEDAYLQPYEGHSEFERLESKKQQ